MKKDNRRKGNNKGFSLVELIIVIAIMAVLVGILAPQFIKYVEQSRVSADTQLLDSVYTTMTTVMVDPDSDIQDSKPDNSTTGSVVDTANTSEYWVEVYEILGVTGGADLLTKLKAEQSVDAADIEYEIGAEGQITITCGTIEIPE